MAVDYPARALLPFVVSARRVVDESADIFCFVRESGVPSSPPEDVVRLSRAHNVTLLTKWSVSMSLSGDVRNASHPTYMRIGLQRQFLATTAATHALITDVRDVYFQANPFVAHTDEAVYVGLEALGLGTIGPGTMQRLRLQACVLTALCTHVWRQHDSRYFGTPSLS